jgi:hypothetical protein
MTVNTKNILSKLFYQKIYNYDKIKNKLFYLFTTLHPAEVHLFIPPMVELSPAFFTPPPVTGINAGDKRLDGIII